MLLKEMRTILQVKKYIQGLVLKLMDMEVMVVVV